MGWASACGRLQPAPSLIAIFFGFTFAYFYQGGGWNQNAQFDTIRAIVERGTVEITEYAHNTGDVGTLNGRFYSNKPPGLALLGAVVYWPLFHLGVPTTAAAHVLTFFTSGLPAVILLLLLHGWFRDQGAAPRENLALVTAFGLGSLVFPYSGVMMNHLLTACLLFGAWRILAARKPTRRAAALAGLLAGSAILTDSLAAAGAAILTLLAVVTHRRALPSYFGAMAAPLAVLAIHNQLAFGSAFMNGQRLPSGFNDPRLFLGMLDWPDWRRLYWITVHPYRGLFLGCPVLLLPLLGLRSARPTPATLAAGAIVAYHIAFLLSFNGWTGGAGIGSRYLIPALPFLFAFALPAYRRFPSLARVLAAISAFAMLAVTATEVLPLAPNAGAPLAVSPVLEAVRLLLLGQLSLSTQSILDYWPPAANPWASYNFGELAGLRGLSSLLPLAIASLIYAWLARRAFPETKTPGRGEPQPGN